MKLTFHGTRGEIDVRSRLHPRNSSLGITYRGRKIVVDAGRDWRGKLDELEGRAFIITHAHPDHAFGLKEGTEKPVWATKDSWEEIGKYPIPDHLRHIVEKREPFDPVEGITFEAFDVEHSIRAPAVGYRITVGRVTVFYAPDLVYIYEREEALAGCSVYIGDGATMKRSLVRKFDDNLVGHASIFTQTGWCEKEGVPRAIFTHLGSQIVGGDERKLDARLRKWADERGIQAEFAHDGQEIVLRS